MKRIIVTCTLSLAAMILLLPMTVFAASRYTDVENHWAEEAMTKWHDLDILVGSDGKFRPDAAMTRGEMAVLMDRIMNYQEVGTNDFTDLDQAFYTNAILKAKAAGVMTGDGTSVRPTAPMTREEAAVMLGRAFGLVQSTVPSDFVDRAAISPWALGYVNAMVAKGYIHGYLGALNPKSSITRAEVVTIIDNAIVGLYMIPAEYTGTLKGLVIVQTPGVILKDMTINGDLIIAEGVGSGSVTFNNVTVTGMTLVRSSGPIEVIAAPDAPVDNEPEPGGGTPGGGSVIQTDTQKVAAAKAAILSGTYTSLPVLDENDQALKTSAVEAVVQSLKGDTTVIVAWNSSTSTYDVAIRCNDASDSLSISATFVDTKPPSFEEGYPKVNVGGTIFQAFLKTDRPATYYYLVYTHDETRSAPLAADILAGQDGAGVKTALRAGCLSDIPAGNETSFSLNNLDEATEYDVFILARSQHGPLSEVQQLSVRTEALVTMPAPTWAVSGSRLTINASNLDETKISDLRYVFEGEFCDAAGLPLGMGVKILVTATSSDLTLFLSVLPANAASLKVRLAEHCDKEIWGPEYVEVVSDYSKPLNLNIVPPEDPVRAITLDEASNIFTVARDTTFEPEHPYILTYTEAGSSAALDYITSFEQICGTTVTFQRYFSSTIGVFKSTNACSALLTRTVTPQ